jgi:hypothetical protein
MTAYPTQKLTTIMHKRQARAATVREAMRTTGENVYRLEALINTTIPQVEREADEFRDYLGEPLPPHAKDALDLELANWHRLKESLELYRLSDPNDADAIAYVRNVRQFLTYQHDLVLLEAELLHSCLVHHYHHLRNDLALRSAQVPL